jgi:hypothetical protein
VTRPQHPLSPIRRPTPPSALASPLADIPRPTSRPSSAPSPSTPPWPCPPAPRHRLHQASPPTDERPIDGPGSASAARHPSAARPPRRLPCAGAARAGGGGGGGLRWARAPWADSDECRRRAVGRAIPRPPPPSNQASTPQSGHSARSTTAVDSGRAGAGPGAQSEERGQGSRRGARTKRPSRLGRLGCGDELPLRAIPGAGSDPTVLPSGCAVR